jgi:hypothetical protein
LHQPHLMPPPTRRLGFRPRTERSSSA